MVFFSFRIMINKLNTRNLSNKCVTWKEDDKFSECLSLFVCLCDWQKIIKMIMKINYQTEKIGSYLLVDGFIKIIDKVDKIQILFLDRIFVEKVRKISIRRSLHFYVLWHYYVFAIHFTLSLLLFLAYGFVPLKFSNDLLVQFESKIPTRKNISPNLCLTMDWWQQTKHDFLFFLFIKWSFESY